METRRAEKGAPKMEKILRQELGKALWVARRSVGKVKGKSLVSSERVWWVAVHNEINVLKGSQNRHSAGMQSIFRKQRNS